jgi:hypothetical protein
MSKRVVVSVMFEVNDDFDEDNLESVVAWVNGTIDNGDYEILEKETGIEDMPMVYLDGII